MPLKHHHVLLTGAAGFIGSHLARLLVAEGHDVTAILRPDTDRWRIRDIEDRLTIVDGDLRAPTGLTTALGNARPDICVHLAWQRPSGPDATDAHLASLIASLELVRVVSAAGCRRIATIGTCFEYDLAHDRLAETTPLRPHDFYGACKKSLFDIGQELSRSNGLRVVTPRVFYCYGPHQDPGRLIPSIVLALRRGEPGRTTPGEQIRDYLHVEDVASAIWAVATSGRTGAVNVASGQPVTVAFMARLIGELLGRPELIQLGAFDYPPDEPMRIVGDVTVLQREIGWRPRFDLQSGLAQTVEWWDGYLRRATNTTLVHQVDSGPR
jgi:nucleoside-diphosphate-sugar epimerase